MFLVGIFQYINFQYLNLFSADNFENLSETAKTQKVQENIDKYNSFNYLGTLFSVSLLFHIILKVIFNLFARVKLPIDKWTIMDALCAFCNLVAFNVIGDMSP